MPNDEFPKKTIGQVDLLKIQLLTERWERVQLEFREMVRTHQTKMATVQNDMKTHTEQVLQKYGIDLASVQIDEANMCIRDPQGNVLFAIVVE